MVCDVAHPVGLIDWDVVGDMGSIIIICDVTGAVEQTWAWIRIILAVSG